jgi:hypothetical protein
VFKWQWDTGDHNWHNGRVAGLGKGSDEKDQWNAGIVGRCAGAPYEDGDDEGEG